MKPEKHILDVHFGSDETTPAIEEEFNLYTARTAGESIAMEYAARLHRDGAKPSVEFESFAYF
ncbi:hypothetical protein ACH4OW_03365 [Streptomyces sp. NPDC017056]|uniref:hypothetical protein n=1 Tax=Streptomyces sp. NPDC017056 TaxID=3364973 RepID=UPI0037895F98